MPWEVAEEEVEAIPEDVAEEEVEAIPEEVAEEVEDDDDDDDDANDDWRWRGELHAATDPHHSERLVVWGSAGMLHSDDDGASFHPILEEDSEVWDVSLSRGRTWALRGRRLHRRGADGHERAWSMPSDVTTDQWFEDYDGDGAAPRIASSGARRRRRSRC